MKRIVLTGGGTAGHVTPNIAMLPALREAGFEVSYIGSLDGIEKALVEAEGVPYYGIATGKLRRYFDPQNFSDPFRVIHGCNQAWALLGKLKPDVVFSKGGFVSVPVAVAAGHRKIPLILHESDMTPGLANRISLRYATRICCNFPETVSHLPEGKAIVTGTPIRQELLAGSREKAAAFCGLGEDKPVILVMGGSQGSVAVNNAVRSILSSILPRFSVIHLCGKGNLDESLSGLEGYVQFEYIREELPDLFALSDLLISRAGANAICEILALRKPNILIPLPTTASRGDQILNAQSFEKQGFSFLLPEETITAQSLQDAIDHVYGNREAYRAAMAGSGNGSDSIRKIVSLITEAAQGRLH